MISRARVCVCVRREKGGLLAKAQGWIVTRITPVPSCL
jgi:hypothetical protein